VSTSRASREDAFGSYAPATMRIATRLWLVLSFVNVVVLGIGVYVRVGEEQQILLDVTLRDRRFFAHALRAALAREDGSVDPLAEARAMLDEQEVAESHIGSRLVSTTGASGLPRPRLPGWRREVLSGGEVVVIVHGAEILTYVPLERQRSIAIELSEPRAVDALVRNIGWRSLVVQVAALAIGAGLVSFLLLGWLVGRPIGKLVSFARRIGEGDFDERVAMPSSEPDEVAILAHEMNDMAERLLTTRRALEESDAERADALERLRHADRLRTVGELASALAHELGTPLNVVSGHARIAEEEADHPEEVRSSARVILEQTHRMTRILRDLLDFARRSSSRNAVHDVAALAARAVETMAPLARRHRAKVVVEGESQRVIVRADGQQILQVLSNLITNAMQALPNGGTIVVRVDEVEVTPPVGVLGKKGRYARIAVIDSGTGIDAEDLPHLFEPFFTKKEEGEGTGLGLAVVEGIVREHGGFVDVESTIGVGTTFRVYLPLRAPE